MNNIGDLSGLINTSGPVPHFDKIGLRMAKKPTTKEMQFLAANCDSASEPRYGHPLRNSQQVWLLPIVAPRRPALEFLAEQWSWLVNYVEPAIDTITDAMSAIRLRDQCDRYFVQPHHG